MSEVCVDSVPGEGGRLRGLKYPGPDKLLGGHVAAWVEVTFRRASRSLWRPLRLITGAARVETAVGSRPAVRRAVPLPNGEARIEIT